MINFLRKTVAILILIMISLTSCEDILKLEVTGDGNIITDSSRWRNTFNIKEIELSENFQLEIYKSEKIGFHIETDSNLIAYIKTDFIRNKLTIRRQSDHNLKPSKHIILRLFTNNLSQIEVWNRGIVFCDTLESNNLTINIYGKSSFKGTYIISENLFLKTEDGANVEIKGEYTFLDYNQKGSGESFLQGNVDILKMTQEGSGKIEALDLTATGANVTLRHSGLIYCNVSNYLSVDLKGNGRVYYKGNPELVDILIEGEGIVEEY